MMIKYIMTTATTIFDTIRNDFPEPSHIHVGKATRIVGETATQFLLKIQHQGQSFLIQTPQGKLKQGFQKASSPGSMKRLACDLVFSVHDSEFFDWIEKLESFCVDYLFQNQKLWFQTDLSVEDVENLFVSPFKIFKSSKTYQLRCHISDLGQSLKVFDADKKSVVYDETFHTDAPVVGVVEVVGIRCSQKHFQIDLELKQLLQLPTGGVLKEATCLIQGPPAPVQGTETTQETEVVKDSGKGEETKDVSVEETAGDSGKAEEGEAVVLEDSGKGEGNVEVSVVVEDSGKESGVDQEQDVYARVLEKARMARNLGVLNYLESKKVGNTQLFLDTV